MTVHLNYMTRIIAHNLLAVILLLASANAHPVEAAVSERYVVPRLSPIPEDIQAYRIGLAGTWKFSTSTSDDFSGLEPTHNLHDIQVPGEWVMQGFQVKVGDSAGYIRTVDIPDHWKGRRVKIRCNGVYSLAELFVNGTDAGEHLGGFTAFETDVTDYIKFGETNTIAMRVTNETLADSVANGSFYAVHQLGGITRDIFLVALPEVNVAMLHTSTSFTDNTYTDACLNTEVTVANESGRNIDKLFLKFTLRDSLGNIMELADTTVSAGALKPDETKNISAVFYVNAPQKWDAEHPYLYTLTCELAEKGKTVTKVSRRVGFRQIEIDGNRMLINGTPVKLRGVCRHETSPDRGRSLTGNVWERDVDIFRRGNVNYIRTSHYPPDEALLEAADRLGMFVEVEAPFCWSHQSKVPAEKHYDIYVRQHLEMLNQYRSHPSVIIWSLGNESVNFPDYKDAARAVKEIDPTRPRNFSQWGPDADEGTLEITNHHYPGPRGPEIYRDYKRPVVFDEFCHMNAYNRLELSADPSLRDMWGEMLDRMWTDMYNSTGVLGGAIWVGIDDTFFLPDGRTVGYGTWGTIDGWRREKPEYWGMKKAYSPVKISLADKSFDNNRIKLNIENRHMFTDLDECVIRWKSGSQTGEISPSIAPRSAGVVEIELPADATQLDISVIGGRGFEVDSYHFEKQAMSADIKQVHREKPSLKKYDNNFTVKSGDRTFCFDKATGDMTAKIGDRCLFTAAPSLMIIPLNGEGEGIQMTGRDQTFAPYNPICSDWEVISVDASRSKESVVVTVCGRYREAEGSFIYRFYNDGRMTIDYDFAVLDSISPRQTGIVFTTPSAFNSVSWSRNGYWNVYPDDHIGALDGRANAFNDALPVSGLAGPDKRPTWGWSLDQTANGSNLFRSTKRSIRHASISSGDGSLSIHIESDGSQHLRPWVDKDETHFLIADYTNGGHDTYLVSHAEPDYRPLYPGDKVKGTVTLSFR